jgi:MoxR-like ATPase
MDDFGKKILDSVHEAVIGQDEIIELLLLSVLAEGHCLIVGVPGLAKTLLANTLAASLGLDFSRIQFTPDLMPTDITGTEIIQEDKKGSRFFNFIKGPVFANFVLADEINRAPPRTQSALLEAMQEVRVTYGREVYPIESPFFVIATQNPIEQEGTYPLPEAQLDRFMLSLKIGYPDEKEEKEIIANPPRSFSPKVKRVTNGKELLKYQNDIKSIPASKKVIDYISMILINSRPQSSGIDFVKKYVDWGVSPRGGQYLLTGAKARAFIHGRPTPSIEDVKSLIPSVFNHRIIVNFLAEADGVPSEKITEVIINETN